MINKSARSFITVFTMVVANRLLGYVRDICLTAALGASSSAQIFVFWFRIFGAIRALFAENAIPTVVIRDHVRYEREHGDSIEEFLAKILLEWSGVCILVMAILATISPILMNMLLPSYVIEENGVVDAYINAFIASIGFSLFVMSSVFAAVFQSSQRYYNYSVMQILPNISFILSLIIMYILKDGGEEFNSTLIALSFLLFGLSQFVFGYIASGLGKVRVSKLYVLPPKLVVYFRSVYARIESLGSVSLFTVTSPAISIIITYIISRNNENITYFFLAERLIQIVPGTLSYAVSVILFPVLIRSLSDNAKRYEYINVCVMLVLGILICTIFMYYSEVIIDMMYKRFSFTKSDADLSSEILSIMSPAVMAMMIEPILLNSVFAKLNERTNVKLLTITIMSMLIVIILFYVYSSITINNKYTPYYLYLALVYARVSSIICTLVISRE